VTAPTPDPHALPDGAGPQGVVVLGMHRSGTSVASLLLTRLGLSGPDPQDQIPPDEDNPKGYFESRSLTTLGDELLADLEASWDAPPPIAEVMQRLPEQRRLEQARTAAGHALTQRPWLWKDPRACLLLPFWSLVLGSEDPVVLVHRSPLDVADSLQRRNGLPIPFGLALWERYNLGALAGARGRPAHVSSYESLLRDPEAWLAEVRTFLCDQGLPLSGVPEDVRSALLTPRARPQATPDGAGQERLEVLLRRLRGPHAALDPPDLPTETPLTETLLSLRRDVVRTEFWARYQTQRLSQAEHRVVELTQQVEQAHHEYRSDRERQRQTHEAQLDRQRREAQQHVGHLEREVEGLTQANQVLQQRAQELAAIEQGGWWRLRRRLLPLLVPAGRLWRRV
jgi:hypothetical protein